MRAAPPSPAGRGAARRARRGSSPRRRRRSAPRARRWSAAPPRHDRAACRRAARARRPTRAGHSSAMAGIGASVANRRDRRASPSGSRRRRIIGVRPQGVGEVADERLAASRRSAPTAGRRAATRPPAWSRSSRAEGNRTGRDPDPDSDVAEVREHGRGVLRSRGRTARASIAPTSGPAWRSSASARRASPGCARPPYQTLSGEPPAGGEHAPQLAQPGARGREELQALLAERRGRTTRPVRASRPHRRPATRCCGLRPLATSEHPRVRGRARPARCHAGRRSGARRSRSRTRRRAPDRRAAAAASSIGRSANGPKNAGTR